MITIALRICRRLLKRLWPRSDLSTTPLARLRRLGGVGETDDVQWRRDWDFDAELASGVVIAYTDGVFRVESWREGQLVASVDCCDILDARQQAALEVPSYLAWRLSHLKVFGRCAGVYVPMPAACAYGFSEVDAVVAQPLPGHDQVRVSVVKASSADDLYSERARRAAQAYFWHAGTATHGKITAARLASDFRQLGVARDCGHLTFVRTS
jgi:hypothetical protein